MVRHYLIPDDKLKELLQMAFSSGALSHANRIGQPGTCWTNVSQDNDEEVSAIMSDIDEFKVLKPDGSLQEV